MKIEKIRSTETAKSRSFGAEEAVRKQITAVDQSKKNAEILRKAQQGKPKKILADVLDAIMDSAGDDAALMSPQSSIETLEYLTNVVIPQLVMEPPMMQMAIDVFGQELSQFREVETQLVPMEADREPF